MTTEEGGGKLKKYYLGEKYCSNTTTWSCTHIPNYNNLTIDNFSIPNTRTISAGSSFGGLGNSDLKGSGSATPIGSYDSKTGIYTVNSGFSTSGRDQSPSLRLNPFVITFE